MVLHPVSLIIIIMGSTVFMAAIHNARVRRIFDVVGEEEERPECV